MLRELVTREYVDTDHAMYELTPSTSRNVLA